MAPETSTQTETRTEPPATAAMPPVNADGALPTPPPVAQQTPLAQPRNGSDPVPLAQPYVLYPGSYGEPFVPYSENRGQQAPQQLQLNPQQFATLQPPVVPERKAWRITKDVLHVLAMVISVVGMGLGFSLLSYGSRSDGIVGTVAACPIFAVALVWSIAEELTRWVRNWGAGIHPGAHVGVSLFLWLCCAVVGGIMAAFIGFYGPDDCYSSGYNSYYGSSSSCSNFYGSWSRFLGVVVLLLLLWLVHFVIFVGACADTAKRNAAKSKPIMVVAQPPYWPMPQQGWQPAMTQQQMTQQPMTQQVYPPQQTYYQQPQFQGMPVQPQAASLPAASGQVEGSGNGKQPEVAQQSTPADHGVREFYNPAGSNSAA